MQESTKPKGELNEAHYAHTSEKAQSSTNVWNVASDGHPFASLDGCDCIWRQFDAHNGQPFQSFFAKFKVWHILVKNHLLIAFEDTNGLTVLIKGVWIEIQYIVEILVTHSLPIKRFWRNRGSVQHFSTFLRTFCLALVDTRRVAHLLFKLVNCIKIAGLLMWFEERVVPRSAIHGWVAKFQKTLKYATFLVVIICEKLRWTFKIKLATSFLNGMWN